MRLIVLDGVGYIYDLTVSVHGEWSLKSWSFDSKSSQMKEVYENRNTGQEITITDDNLIYIPENMEEIVEALYAKN